MKLKFTQSPVADLIRNLPKLQINTVFDVGANVGQSIEQFQQAAPSAAIYAFEPANSSYAHLQAKYTGRSNVQLFNLGLSDAAGTAFISDDPLSSMNRLTKSPASASNHEVRMETGDRLCAELSISAIDFLKIDTEGFDLTVCHGFKKMFREHQIAAVQVEASMNKWNTLHVAFREFQDFMDQHDYELWYIYEQAVSKKRFHLRRANPVFVSKKVLKQHYPKKAPTG